MSGLALIFDSQEPVAPGNETFKAFKDSVAGFKQLNSTCWEVSGRHCSAAKFDTPSTLHRGITVDEHNGSWLLAVGTVLDSERDYNDGYLQTLLTDYLRQGNAAFQSLDGAFALVIYNKLADRLAIVSDPSGHISIFCARRGNRFYVATSALAVAEAVRATPSEYGTYLFLTLGCVSGKSTLWQEVERLPGGTVLEIANTGTTESVYWAPTIEDEVTQLSLTETVEHSFDFLSWLLKQHLKREGRIWADLTGGFDTRLLTMMMYHCGLPFKATCEGPLDSPDVRISSRIAGEMGWAYRHAMLPDNWGQERYERLSQALGKGDGHLGVFKLTSVLRDQEQKALEHNASIWGHAGELWRGLYWRQELGNVGKSPDVNYDRLLDYRLMPPVERTVFSDVSRVKWIREEVKSVLKSVGDRYADSPNTVKLDCVLLYKGTGFSGTLISAAMGQQRVIVPFLLKDSITFVISTYFKWRNHGRLVRLLMEQVNPVLAGFETTRGGPALPMRATNLHRFIPYWSRLGTQLVRKASCALLGRSLLPEARSAFASYPLARWRRETLDCLEQDNMLNPAYMHSGRLYDAEHLANFLERARTEEFPQETFLSRILTVEMALRAVGASF